MAWLAVDDTDSLGGGCTTHVAWKIAQSLRGVSLAGAASLVRLNPNVPFKTRGNGAIRLDLAQPHGPAITLGQAGPGSSILGFPKGARPTRLQLARAFVQACRVVEAEASPSSQPAVVAGFDAPDPREYWQTVRRMRSGAASRRWARQNAVHWRTWRGGRGLIGAVAAAAWTGSHDSTWEAIAFRQPRQLGTPRRIDDYCVESIHENYSSLFDTWDAKHRAARAVPSSPCPVLVGLRGTNASDAMEALGSIGPEVAAGSMVFRSNQGTGDHVGERGAWGPFSTHRFGARVAAAPVVVRGGHVFVKLDASAAVTTAAAYEPTKEFRNILRALIPGDVVDVVGSFHEDTGTVALEELSVVSQVTRLAWTKPRCPACGRSMSSRGRAAGFRCDRCRTRAPAGHAHPVGLPRGDLVGRHRVPVVARRHLAARN